MNNISYYKQWNKSALKRFQAAEILRKENEYCDITLQSVDGIDVNAHKIILVIGSDYFKAKFSSGANESRENFIKFDLPSIKGDVLEKVTSFIYTGKLKAKTLEELEEIIVCANYFQLENLVLDCANLLTEYINDNNCLKYWRLSRKISQNDFEKKCISYVFSSGILLNDNEMFFIDLDKYELEKLLIDERTTWTEEMKFKKLLEWTKNKCCTKEEFGSTFLKLLNIINFSKITKKFALKAFRDNDLAEHEESRIKIIDSIIPEKEHLSEETDEDESCEKTEMQRTQEKTVKIPNAKNTGKTLFTLIGDKLYTISDDGILGKFQRKENIMWNRECTVFNNSLFICGGRNTVEKRNPGSDICEYFNASTKEWKDLPSLKTSRFWHRCVNHEDKIYVCGGFRNGAPISSVEIFEFGQTKWIQGRNLSSARHAFGFVSIDRCLYILGGYGNKGNIERFDSRTPDQWEEVYEDSQLQKYTQCISLNNDIYCFQSGSVVRIFDIKGKQFRESDWTNNAIHIKEKSFFKVCYLDDYFYFIEANCLNSYADFSKFDLKGEKIFTKEKIYQMEPSVPFNCLDVLYYSEK